jgi:hypothetical protein
MNIIEILASEFGLKVSQVENTVALIDEGNTIPFIARYRKEVTGGMSDEVLRDLDERLTYLRNLEERKEEVIRLIDEQGKLTDELKEKILAAEVLQRVEDLYKPYTVEYFVVEMDSNVAAPIRLTVLKGLPKFSLTDTLHLSSKYETLLEDGLCVKLCQRYKLMDIKSDFERDFEDQKYKIKRINYANRPVIYNGFGKSWDTNFSNFAGGLGWG